MAVTQPDNLIGSVVGGRYEIIARVNRGGTAVVYRGIDRRLGRTVAIKVIHSDLSGDADYVKRFDREARAAAILSHPNIVAVFDQGHAGDRPYIVMEYVHGQSLRSIISASAPLPVPLALFYADEVAKALAAAHDAGIIHRDIKPENVLITNDGQVKVTDFGLAKTISSQTSTASHGVLMGTMSYIAPEIPQSGSAAKTSDIYSTGVMMYEMLTGKKPHVGEDLSQVLYKHVHVDIPPPSQALTGQARAKVPDYVDALVTACTSRDQANRPADGRVLQDRIARARRSLDAGLMHDADLIHQITLSPQSVERTPVAPHHLEVTSSDQAGRKEHTPVHGTTVSATRLTKASATSRPAVTYPAPRRTRPKRRLVGLVIVVATVLVASLLGWWLAVGRWTTVPVMAGMPEQDARSAAVAQSLTWSTPLQAYSETVPVGAVIRTDPAEGDRVKKGSAVTAYISKGPERYAMPTVVGLSQDEAKAAILTAHLAVGTVTQDWSDDSPVGQVVSVSQEPGASLPPNTAIDLVVSKGPQPITIDSYVGQAGDAASQALSDAGFQVTTSQATSCTVAAGQVISQSPDAGTGSDGSPLTGHRGDTITLTISTGTPMATVPDVRGNTRASALQKLGDAGFVSDAIEVRNVNPMGLPLGLVTSTDPGPGGLVSACSIVVNIV
ncbi:MAG: Stk1 family PASTA domain-containing Ser/Thr kinase [Propionibacteriaceae bacterium]|nr:Stk1 family PASTA domain-containing Ser/Thr kinase [Propionibacteriaceae bacterium]